MIVAYTGLMGSGKTYGVVENVIIPHLKNNRKIVTNIPLYIENFSPEIDTDLITVIDLVEDEETNTGDYIYSEGDLKGENIYHHVINGALYILDEVQINLPSDLRKNQLDKKIIRFYSKGRHFIDENGRTVDVVIVTQDLSNVCNFLRSLVRETFRVVKLDTLGKAGSSKYRVDCYNSPVTGSSPPVAKRTRQAYGFYKEDITKLYKSHTEGAENLDTQFLSIDEQKIDNRSNIYNSSLVKFGLPISIAVFLFASYKISGFFSPAVSNENLETKVISSTNKNDTPKNTYKSDNNNDEDEESNIFGISEKYHISYIYENHLGTHEIMISDGRRDYPIQSKACMKVPPYGYVCSVEGHVITTYSGTANQPYVDENVNFHFGNIGNSSGSNNLLKKTNKINPFEES